MNNHSLLLEERRRMTPDPRLTVQQAVALWLAKELNGPHK